MSDDAASDDEAGCRINEAEERSIAMIYTIVSLFTAVTLLMVGVRVVSAAVFFRKSWRNLMTGIRIKQAGWSIINLHVSAILTGVCALISMLGFLWFWSYYFILTLKCRSDPQSEELGKAMMRSAATYWLGTFLSFAFYVLWLVCRDRALQCAYFRTDKMLVYPQAIFAVVAYFVFWFYFHSCKYPIHSCWGGHKEVAEVQQYQGSNNKPVRLFDMVELGITLYFTWLFFRGLGPSHVGAATSPLLREILIRTAVGAIFTAAVVVLGYIVTYSTSVHVDPDDSKHPDEDAGSDLKDERFAYLCYVVFACLNLFPKVFHIFVSHRDDKALRFQNLAELYGCSGCGISLLRASVETANDEEVREVERLRSEEGARHINVSMPAPRASESGDYEAELPAVV